MPIRINIDAERCAAKVTGAWEKQLYALSGQILQDCNEFCKEDHRTLILSSGPASRLKEGVLVWDTKYAKRQYWDIQTSLTPGRTWKWCETAKKKYRERWRKQAEKGLRDNL